MRRAVLTDIQLPDYGDPVSEPGLGRPIYAARLARLRERMRLHGLGALVIYGDREHVANIAWATGHDPRFEEALLLVLPDRTPVLFAGNEGYPLCRGRPGPVRAQAVAGAEPDGPAARQAPPARRSAARGRPRARHAHRPCRLEGLRDGGWHVRSRTGSRRPHYLVETLRQFGEVSNAALLFMNPQDGLRVINEADQIACFEYASTKTSSALRRLILGVKPGMTEFDACRTMGLDGSMQSVHINMSSGPRARYRPVQPVSSRIIARAMPSSRATA